MKRGRGRIANEGVGQHRKALTWSVAKEELTRQIGETQRINRHPANLQTAETRQGLDHGLSRGHPEIPRRYSPRALDEWRQTYHPVRRQLHCTGLGVERSSPRDPFPAVRTTGVERGHEDRAEHQQGQQVRFPPIHGSTATPSSSTKQRACRRTTPVRSTTRP